MTTAVPSGAAADPQTVRAAVADVAAAIERATADLALAEEPSRFIARLEAERG